MRTLHIIVSNKQAIFSRREGGVVCGNADYQIEFHFDAEWRAYETKTARFIWNGKSKDVVFNGSVCPVPIVANTTTLEVGVFVENLSTTTSAIIPCNKSILCNANLKDEGTVVMPEGLIKPSGSMSITSNGIFDVTELESVIVNVDENNIKTFTMSVGGGNPLGIIYFDGEKTVSWADTATIAPLTVACDTPIAFYDPMSSSMGPITISYYATGALDIQPLREHGGVKIYVIPSSEWAGSLIDISY